MSYFSVFHKGHFYKRDQSRVEDARVSPLLAPQAGVHHDFSGWERSVTPRGLELPDASSLWANDLRQTQQAGAAQSGAVTADALLAMLLSLSPDERDRLLSLLRSQDGERK